MHVQHLAQGTLLDCYVHSHMMLSASSVTQRLCRVCVFFAVPRLPVPNLPVSASWIVLSSADVLPRTFLVPLSTAPEQQLIPASTAQECFGLCRNRTSCGMAIYNPAGNTCFPALLVGMNSSALSAATPQQALARQGCTDAAGCVITMRTPGSCGLVVSSGLFAFGMQWATWTPGKIQHTCMQRTLNVKPRI